MGFKPPQIISTTHTWSKNVRFMCKLVLLLNTRQWHLHNVKQRAGKLTQICHMKLCRQISPRPKIHREQHTAWSPPLRFHPRRNCRPTGSTFQAPVEGAESEVWRKRIPVSLLHFTDWKRRTESQQNSPSVCRSNEHRGEYKGKMWFPARHSNECSQTQTSPLPLLSEQGVSCDKVCIHYFPTGLFMNVLNSCIHHPFTLTLESII